MKKAITPIRLAKSLFAASLVLGVHSAQAELPQILLAFHNKITAIGGGTTSANAKDNIAKCKALSEDFKAVADLTPDQLSYAAAQVENCIAIVMQTAQLTDGSGDGCSHHLAYVSKIADLAEAVVKEKGQNADFVAEIISQLEHAGEKAQLIGCKADYTSFAPRLAAVKAAAPDTTDLSFMKEILAATVAITPENAKSAAEKCNGFGERLVAMQDLSDVEGNYYVALIEQCSAVATEKGKFTDEQGGDVCSHTYSFAQSLHEAIEVAKNRPGVFQNMLPDMQASLGKAVSHSAELKCSQDLSGLR